jgi:bacterioferritin
MVNKDLDGNYRSQGFREPDLCYIKFIAMKQAQSNREEKMKGNEQILAHLNMLLADELTATNQYILHSEMCANWGFERLHHKIEKRAIDEMKHAETLIARILYLEGRPVVSKLNDVHVGAEVKAQFENDYTSEQSAVKAYNDGIRLAAEVGDNGSRAMMETILRDEEDHIDWLEAQLEQIHLIGEQNYLAQQIEA